MGAIYTSIFICDDCGKRVKRVSELMDDYEDIEDWDGRWMPDGWSRNVTEGRMTCAKCDVRVPTSKPQHDHMSLCPSCNRYNTNDPHQFYCELGGKYGK
jgi:DNA-directed RNA polymerase subunit RPC12/RpoP